MVSVRSVVCAHFVSDNVLQILSDLLQIFADLRGVFALIKSVGWGRVFQCSVQKWVWDQERSKAILEASAFSGTQTGAIWAPLGRFGIHFWRPLDFEGSEIDYFHIKST